MMSNDYENIACAMQVTFSDGSYFLFIKIGDGKIFSETSSSIVKLNFSKLAQNAKAIGGNVKLLSKSQLDNIDKKRKVYRIEMDAFLDSDNAAIGGNRSQQRKMTAARRGTKKSI